MNNETNTKSTKNVRINSSSLFPKKTNFNLYKILHSIWQSFVKKIFTDPNELEVWQKVDRYGNIYWQAYDPKTGKSFSSGSETDVCMWIEQLHKY